MSFQVGELYGFRLGSSDKDYEKSSSNAELQAAYQSTHDDLIGTTSTGQLTAQCRFKDDICNGGGNRDMMRLPASDQTVGILFSKEVGQKTGGFLPCGVCTVLQKKQNKLWAICPHRLFAIGPNGVADPHQWLANRVFTLFEYESGDSIEVWSEVKLADKSVSGAKFNYRLDYVLRRQGLNPSPVIIEIMTCSTSGGNKMNHTDMKSAFKNATLTAKGLNTGDVRSLGVNLRQVWARMASQLIAKSEAAIAWGGKTVWIVQDHLANYIRTQTALPLDELHSPNWEPGEVNLVVSDLNGSAELYSGPIRSQGASRACWLEILGAPHVPAVESLMAKLDTTTPIAKIRIA